MAYIDSNKISLKEKIDSYLVKDIVAFLNSEGGIIYIGIDKKGSIIGINNTACAPSIITFMISEHIVPDAIGLVKTEVLEEDSKAIIKITISKGLGNVFCIREYGYSPIGCYYRNNTDIIPMPFNMIRSRLEASTYSLDITTRIKSCNQNLSFNIIKLLLSESGNDVDCKTFYEKYNLYTYDGKYNYFAELISDNSTIPLTFVKYREKDKSTLSNRIDFGCQCIVIGYEKMMSRLLVENRCKTILNPRPRKDIFLYDLKAVKEALINAILYNDYMTSSPQVTLFSDRIEFTSHGGLPSNLSQEDYLSGINNPRNKELMNIFIRLGIIENTDHSISTIIKKYSINSFTITSNHIRITIPFNKEVMSSL